MQNQKITYSDAYYSIQGEGYYCGHPSVILKTFGCNLKCRGFGMPKNKLSSEYKKIEILPKYKKVSDLPSVKTGCDSYFSWDPKFEHLAHSKTPDELATELTRLTPNLTWLHKNKTEIHLVLTGGEPLLAWQFLYINLFNCLAKNGLRNVTFETNGTQDLKPKFSEYLHTGKIIPHFSVSPKLSNSGEKRENVIFPEVIHSYAQHGLVTLKFVVSNEKDCVEAMSIIEEYNSLDAGKLFEEVYFMPVGSDFETYGDNFEDVATLASKFGVGISPRLHLDLFDDGRTL